MKKNWDDFREVRYLVFDRTTSVTPRTAMHQVWGNCRLTVFSTLWDYIEGVSTWNK